MEVEKKLQIWETDANAFAQRVERFIGEVYDEALEEAMASFPLLGLVMTKAIDRDLKSFSYTPSMRSYLMADEADEFDCTDNDDPVHIAAGKTYRGETKLLGKRLELCMVTCRGLDLREEVKTKVKAVIQVILLGLQKSFWRGNPTIGQFGLLNHPEAEKNKIESPFKWSAATDNQVAMQLVKATKNKTNPKVIVAENIYNSSIGLSHERDGSSGCSLRSSCIAEVIQAQEGSSFDGMIQSSEDLNANTMRGDMVIVYDADAMHLTKSEIFRITAQAKGLQQAHARLLMNTSGLVVEYSDAITVIYGAGDGAK